MPHPAGLPDVFVDRSLGRIQAPTPLRASGLRLVTLAERYGIPADEGIQDTQWLADAGERGEVVFIKDARVRYNAAEKLAIVRHGVRCFCLSRQDLAAGLMAAGMAESVDAECERVTLFDGRQHSSGPVSIDSGSGFADLFDPPVVLCRHAARASSSGSSRASSASQWAVVLVASVRSA